VSLGLSLKTAEAGDEEKSVRAGNRTAGRNRHLAVDTLELLLTVVVHVAAGKSRAEPTRYC